MDEFIFQQRKEIVVCRRMSASVDFTSCQADS